MTIVEEAFDLARSGENRSIPGIASTLKSRNHPIGFIEDHLSVRQILAESTRVCREELSQEQKRAPDEALSAA